MVERRILAANGEMMAEVLCEAMERMAFICAAAPQSPQQPPDSPMRVYIDFRLGGGEILELVAGEDFGKLLAGNILSDASFPVDKTTAQDALRELVNVTCGTLLARLGATAAQMGGMTIPSVSSFDIARWPALLANPGSAVVDAEGHIVVARLGRAA
jgi:hypothetical protein